MAEQRDQDKAVEQTPPNGRGGERGWKYAVGCGVERDLGFRGKAFGAFEPPAMD